MNGVKTINLENDNANLDKEALNPNAAVFRANAQGTAPATNFRSAPIFEDQRFSTVSTTNQPTNIAPEIPNPFALENNHICQNEAARPNHLYPELRPFQDIRVPSYKLSNKRKISCI